MVSEIMLQQTQVNRVYEKYLEFIKKFPTLQKLASASQLDVLKEWQGLGYNRRALNLKKACSIILDEYKGVFPEDYRKLIKLPGVGQSTAGAILNFSFNIATPFIETNIRSVYIHFYFKKSKLVSDKKLIPIIERTINTKDPRNWFYALYDYGAHLKSSLGKNKTTLHKKSSHYVKQKPFKGSNRELRSMLLKLFLQEKNSEFSLSEISRGLKTKKEALIPNLGALKKEGFIEEISNKSLWRLKL
jgi:A/G-specific adenine glycosylase